MRSTDHRPTTINTISSYDYIITGAGCAGLSLAVHLAEAGLLQQKKLLLIDKNRKTVNDRTWCFWENKAGPFETIVHHSWKQAWIRNDHSEQCMELDPYRYKMIRGIDFYTHCTEVLKNYPSIELAYHAVSAISASGDKMIVRAGENTYQADFVFNSIPKEIPDSKPKEHFLLQHFKGWFIETADKAFDPARATLMDFRVPQQGGTGFVYIMPFSSQTALVEYTIISPEVLKLQHYDEVLADYLRRININNYTISESEFGIIPMTSRNFPIRDNNMIYIGTAGGQTKPSSGYTFSFIQKQSAAIVDSIKKTGKPFTRINTKAAGRFRWYDKILLNILEKNQPEGREIFPMLFRKNEPALVLKFLDNETSLLQDLKILQSVPQIPFIKAGIREIFR